MRLRRPFPSRKRLRLRNDVPYLVAARPEELLELLRGRAGVVGGGAVFEDAAADAPLVEEPPRAEQHLVLQPFDIDLEQIDLVDVAPAAVPIKRDLRHF